MITFKGDNQYFHERERKYVDVILTVDNVMQYRNDLKEIESKVDLSIF